MDQVETGSFEQLRSGTKQPQSVRVVSWNVDRGCKLKQILEYLSSANGDIILLQEADRNTRRSGHLDVARKIAEELRMHYAFGCEFIELSEGTQTSPAHHGQVTLSRWPLLHPRVLRFRAQSNFWRPRWYVPTLSPFQRRIGGRIALVTELSIGQCRVLTYNVHLESRGNDDLRLGQLVEVLRDCSQFGDQALVLVAGDFNFDLRHPRVAAAISAMHFKNPFAAEGSEKFTARSRLGRGRSIDFILTRGFPATTDSEVADLVLASDHFPIALTLIPS